MSSGFTDAPKSQTNLPNVQCLRPRTRRTTDKKAVFLEFNGSTIGCFETRWLMRTPPTNRCTGGTGGDFRIIIGPAQLLGNTVARSTRPLGGQSTFDARPAPCTYHVQRDASDSRHTRRPAG